MGDAGGKTGTLYVVATPIGNLDDMTGRSVATLRSVQLIAAEDTRLTGRLCAHYAIDTPMVPYHEHNEVRQTAMLLDRLRAGEDVAVVSDAGTPLISDPGFRLVSAARDARLDVVPVPGPCAAVAALSAAGLASHRFHFEGFLPAKPGARRRRLEQLRETPETMIFYESVHRIQDTLADMCDVLGAERQAALARELTKLHETIRRDTLGGIVQWVAADPWQRKGEHVILVEGAAESDDGEGERVLDILCEQLPVSQAAELAAKITGAARNRLYRLALRKTRNGDGGN
ncbi:MAG: 16S rRNA (cytidine(1402)-2'-O)-methyltransferase [Gammaproteobacteria bacterium]|nr:16S rRNA (cytidine(1402)-2'-O)-methyltransferase [Gammaproteobacteria bacterium]